MSALKEACHSSHEILHRPNTITGLYGDRFGEEVECNKCGASGYATVAGTHLDYELKRPCEYGDPLGYWMYRVDDMEKSLKYARDKVAELRKAAT